MMKIRSWHPLIFLLFIVLASCKNTNFEEIPNEQKKKLVTHPKKYMSKIEQEYLLHQARRMITLGRYDAARKFLDPLIKVGLQSDETVKLDRIIHMNQTKIKYDRLQENTRDVLMEEVEQGLVLPKKYGKTVDIDSKKTQPLPVIPIEKLMKQKVSMNLQNANLEDVIMALSEINNLNIIADNALTSEQTLTVKVDDIPLKELLDYISRNMEIAFHPGENIIWVTEQTDVSNNGPELEMKIFRLKTGYIPEFGGTAGEGMPSGIADSSQFNNLFTQGNSNIAANELEDILNMLLADSPEGAFHRIYKNRNLLVVKNTRSNIRIVEDVLKEFDCPIQQVLITARFITISQEDLHEVGFNLSEITPNDPKPNDKVQTVTNNLLANFPQGSGNLEIAGIIDDWKYEVIIRALDEKSSTKTISSPKVSVLNNHVAMIRRGEKLRYYEEYELESIPNELGVAVSQPVPTGDVQELDLGINFYVKPTIGSDSEHIMLSLKPYIAEFLGWEEFITAKLPKTNESNIETTVVVKSGETVVLGGMITNTKEDDRSRIPIISSIPFIGELFGNNVKSSRPMHLIVFITAVIVDSSGEFVKVREDKQFKSYIKTPEKSN